MFCVRDLRQVWKALIDHLPWSKPPSHAVDEASCDSSVSLNTVTVSKSASTSMRSSSLAVSACSNYNTSVRSRIEQQSDKSANLQEFLKRLVGFSIRHMQAYKAYTTKRMLGRPQDHWAHNHVNIWARGHIELVLENIRTVLL
jgi:hypothetical protein